MKLNRELIFHLIIDMLGVMRVFDCRHRYDVKLKAWVIEIPDKEPK